MAIKATCPTFDQYQHPIDAVKQADNMKVPASACIVKNMTMMVILTHCLQIDVGGKLIFLLQINFTSTLWNATEHLWW